MRALLDLAASQALRQALAIVTILASAIANADYSWQVSGGLHADRADVLESSRTTLSAIYYFTEVDYTDGPYELAPFMSQSGYIKFDGSWGERTEGFELYTEESIQIFPEIDMLPTDGWWSTDRDDFELSPDASISDASVTGRYVWNDSGWYLGGRLQRRLVDQPGRNLTMQRTTSGFRLSGGKFVDPVTSLEMRVGSTDRDSTLEVQLSLPFLRTSIDLGSRSTIENLGFSVRRAGLLGGSIYWLSANLGFVRTHVSHRIPPLVEGYLPEPVSDRSTNGYEYGFSFGLYPTRAVGIRMLLSRGADGSGLAGIATSWFVVSNAAIEFTVARTKFVFDSLSAEVDSVSLRLLGRI